MQRTARPGGCTHCAISLWSEIQCDSVRCMKGNIVQQRSVVVVVVLEDRAG
jgi:hypothetical protein